VAVTTRVRASSRAPRAVGRATAPGGRLLGSQARVAGPSAALLGIALTPDLERAPAGGLGLTSMRGRAAVVAAQLRLKSVVRAGTIVEVGF
jgi:hypothetical protein